MTPKRPKELKWIGKTYGDGRPVEFINDVEPRDYDEDETHALTQDQLASARHSGLYREVHAPEKKAAKAAQKKTVEKDLDPAPLEPGAVDNDAAEPATEGDGN